jgi:hypothetical protein
MCSFDGLILKTERINWFGFSAIRGINRAEVYEFLGLHDRYHALQTL